MNNGMIFEVIPNTKTASESYTKKVLDRIADVINEMSNINILNIPEVVEENHNGQPYYKNIDNREFGLMLRDMCNKDIMVNTVVAHYDTKHRFEQWLDESISKYNIKNFVFVGAKISGMKYPGPSIIEANSIAKRKNINFGNIFIPERENEIDRLISKTAAGCNFFTSQVLFEADKVIDVIHKYSTRCEKDNLKPAKFFLSFSPVSNFGDITFVKWLGTEIKEETENRLRAAQNTGEESIKVILEVLHKVFDFADKMNINVPLGLNVEYISLHNLELSKNLVNVLSDSKAENL